MTEEKTLIEAIEAMPDEQRGQMGDDVTRALTAVGITDLTEDSAAAYVRTLKFFAQKYKLKWSE